MKKLNAVIAVIVVLAGAAAIIVPRVVPLETYKAQIAERVRSATGRDLRIESDIHLSVLPKIALEVGKVSFANAPGAAEADMATLSALAVEVRWLPLLKGEVAIDRFVLTDPVIILQVDAKGRPNWVFGDEAGAGAATAAPSDGGGGPSLAGLEVGDVRLVNGRLIWEDAVSGRREEVSGLNVTVVPTGSDGRTGVVGQATWHGRQLQLDVAVENIDRLLKGERVGGSVKLAGAPLDLSYQGQLALGDAPQIGGDLKLDVPSVRGLLDWVGSPVDMPGDGLGPLALSGSLDIRGKSIVFKSARIAIDGMTSEGDLEVNLLGRVPYIRARLAADRLDLNRYMAPADEKASPAEQYQGPGKWSEEPIDLAALKLVNADIDLRTEAILVRDLKIGRTVLAIQLKDGRLAADLKELALYEGKGAAAVVVDGRGKVPELAARFSLAGLRAEPLLRDAAGFERLTGNAETRIDVTSKGTSELGIVSALQGKGAIRIGDGAIKGIDIGAMIRNVKSAFATGQNGAAAKTEFAELAGTFTIRDGTVRNDDLRLLAPLFRLAGKGQVPLPPRTLAYRLEPKLAATTEGQGGKADAAGLMVPVIVEGPWHDLSYRPDLAGLVGKAASDPGRALEAVKDLKAGGKEGLKGALGKITGGGSAAPAPAPTPDADRTETPPPALAPLKKLFGN